MPSSLLYHCLCALCFLPLVITAQKNGNITLGESLTAGNDTSSSWVSPSGDFAFGFQQVGTGGFLIAIWFNNIPEKTVTWSPKTNLLAQLGSKLQLTEDGRLVLNNPSGAEMWSLPVGGASYAAMLDTGNFVLARVNSDVWIWESFGEPTDTILPTQIVSKEISLRSRVSDTNYSTGKFQLRMQTDGNLVFYMMYTTNYTDQYLPAYDATGTFGTDFQMVFNQSGSLYVTAQDGSTEAVVLQDNSTDQSLYYQRAILEFDGVFRKYVFPRSSSTSLEKKWTVNNLRPRGICTRAGSPGVCGLNSICQIGDDQMQRPTCECPPGYIFLDQTDQMEGCKPNFTQQICLDGPQENNGQFRLEEMPSAISLDASYETITTTSEVQCHSSCLSDCYCAAVTIGTDSCIKMKFPLSNMWFNKSEGASTPSKALIKVGIGSSTSIGPDQDSPTIQQKETDHRTVILVGSFFLGGSVFLNIVLLTLAVFTGTLCTYKRKAKTREDQDIAGTNMRSFSYKELEEATNGFKEVVGQGAFATVYKGLLDSEEGNVIAVKKLNEMVKDNQREFESEVKAIARTDHRNLVQLKGFCNEGQHRLLVYEYMPNGSLADIFHQHQTPINLSRRMKFALDTARGLNYLHEECSIQIIHCDIKLQNVLLDNSFTARISDFGMAKLMKKDQTHTMTGIRGTKGYVAPEWFKSVPVTTKVDVYSYGILLLELICCRRCFEAELEDESQMVLADWAYDCYQEGRVDKLVDGDDEALAEIESIRKFVMIALWCIHEVPSLRPSMNKVVQMMKEALEETLPQDPALYITPMSMFSGSSQTIQY